MQKILLAKKTCLQQIDIGLNTKNSNNLWQSFPVKIIGYNNKYLKEKGTKGSMNLNRKDENITDPNSLKKRDKYGLQLKENL